MEVKMRNPLKIPYYLRQYYGKLWYFSRIGLWDCLTLWWIIEG